MGSSSTVGMSSTFLSDMTERASNFGTWRLLVFFAPAVNTGDMPDTMDRTPGKSSGGLWEALTHAGVQHCADPLLQAQPVGSWRTHHPAAPAAGAHRRNGTAVTAPQQAEGRWLSGTKGALCTCPASINVISTVHTPYWSKYFLTQHLKFLHLQISNG